MAQCFELLPNTTPEENDAYQTVKGMIRAIQDKAAGDYKKEQLLLSMLNGVLQHRWERIDMALLEADPLLHAVPAGSA